MDQLEEQEEVVDSHINNIHKVDLEFTLLHPHMVTLNLLQLHIILRHLPITMGTLHLLNIIINNICHRTNNTFHNRYLNIANLAIIKM